MALDPAFMLSLVSQVPPVGTGTELAMRGANAIGRGLAQREKQRSNRSQEQLAREREEGVNRRYQAGISERQRAAQQEHDWGTEAERRKAMAGIGESLRGRDTAGVMAMSPYFGTLGLQVDLEDVGVTTPQPELGDYEPGIPGGAATALEAAAAPSQRVLTVSGPEGEMSVNLDELDDVQRAQVEELIATQQRFAPQVERPSREMAAEMAGLAGGSPAELIARQEAIAKPQLDRESRERMARMRESGVNQRFAMGGGGDGMGRVFDPAQTRLAYNQASSVAREIVGQEDLKAAKSGMDALRHARKVFASREPGMRTAQNAAIKEMISAVEDGRVSDADFRIMSGRHGIMAELFNAAQEGESVLNGRLADLPPEQLDQLAKAAELGFKRISHRYVRSYENLKSAAEAAASKRDSAVDPDARDYYDVQASGFEDYIRTHFPESMWGSEIGPPRASALTKTSKGGGRGPSRSVSVTEREKGQEPMRPNPPKDDDAALKLLE